MASWSGRPPFTSASARRFDARRRSLRLSGVGSLLLGLLVVAVPLPAQIAAQTETLDRILAVVNGQVIMASDVRAFIDLRLVDVPAGPGQEAEVLTYLIERRVILDQVDRFAVAEPSGETVTRRLEAIRAGLSGGTSLEEVLERVGFTEDDLRQLVTDEIRRDAYAAERFAAVAEAQRTDAMDDWVEDLIRRAQVRRVAVEGSRGPGLR